MIERVRNLMGQMIEDYGQLVEVQVDWLFESELWFPRHFFYCMYLDCCMFFRSGISMILSLF